MSREVDAMASKAISFPRVSGDEPVEGDRAREYIAFSLRERG